MNTRWTRSTVVMIGLALGGCAGGEDASVDETLSSTGDSAASNAPAPPPPPPVLTSADTARLLEQLDVELASVRAKLADVSSLRAREVAQLRQDRNAEQISAARTLGMRASGDAEIARLVQQEKLVALGDSTDLWVLRPMEHSVPFVTPDTRVMLQELGRRFHARLDSIGLPHYRMQFTSALRTADKQADLRRVNSNASATVSAHEFGTTVDISYERFAAPVAVVRTSATAREPLDALRVVAMDSLARRHSGALRAELGRAIYSMKQEGWLHVMMENSQTVYHMTLGRGFDASEAVAARD